MLAAHQAREELGLDKTLKLATCGWTVGPRVQREYFDTVLPDDWTISSINEGVGNVDCEPEYAKIVRHPKWSIPWMEDDPGLLGLQFWANRTLVYAAQAAEYGVEGLLGSLRSHDGQRLMRDLVSHVHAAVLHAPPRGQAVFLFDGFRGHRLGQVLSRAHNATRTRNG